MLIKAIISTFDNLPMLKQQLTTLRNDPLISEIIVVENDCEDGTDEWLRTQTGLTVVNVPQNRGASIARNAGLDAAGKFDYALMLDGGIGVLQGGTQKMLDYMERRRDEVPGEVAQRGQRYCDVLGLEIADMVTDPEKAWRRWPGEIKDSDTYRNTRLSHTAYCLARWRAFDGIRFCTEGPFGEAGYAVEDDQLAYIWHDLSIVVHVVTNIHPYRRINGSFGRLFRETGIWPNGYGSVYEKRLCFLQQNYAKHQPGVQWGEAPPERTVIIDVADLETTIELIKFWHDEFRKDRFEAPYSYAWKPYRIEVRCPAERIDFLEWAEPRRLRQHHGDTIIESGEIVRRNSSNEALWTGDFILEITIGLE